MTSFSPHQSKILEILYLLYLLRSSDVRRIDSGVLEFKTKAIEDCLRGAPALSLRSLVRLFELGIISHPSVEIIVRIGDKPLVVFTQVFPLDRGFEPYLYELEIESFRNEHTPRGSHHKELSRTFRCEVHKDKAQFFLKGELLSWAHNLSSTSSGASLYDSSVQMMALLGDIKRAMETDTEGALTIVESDGDVRMEKIMAALWLEHEDLIRVRRILWNHRKDQKHDEKEAMGYCPALLIELRQGFFHELPPLSELEREEYYRQRMAEIMGNSVKVRITPSGEWVSHERYSPRHGSFARLLGQLLVKKQALEIPWNEVRREMGKSPGEMQKAPLDIRKALSNLKTSLQDHFPYIQEGAITVRGLNLVLAPDAFELSHLDAKD